MQHYHAMTASETAEQLKTDAKKGLSSKEAKKRLTQYGENVLAEKKQKNIFTRFVSQFNDFMIIILLAAAAVSFVTGAIDGDSDLAEPIIILAIVILNAVLGLVQENKAAKSLAALKKMSAPHARVIRDGQETEISAQEVVPGDLLVLSAGDIAAADCRLIQSINLQSDESSLTGESVPAVKDSGCVLDPLTALGDRTNMVLSSAWITEGRGLGLVTATGMNTEVGHIAGLILSAESTMTPLQKRLAQAGKYLGIGALAICGIIFIMGLFRHLPPFDMFVTSVSLAVAAIPEGLPAIVTIMLAIGVQKMAARGAIIRNLPSVETLGSAGVICSDKTGTLTRNCMEIKTEWTKDPRLLYKCAVLCCQAHSKNPTEQAILNEGEKRGLLKQELDNQNRLLDEIPFNSSRKRMTTLHSTRKGCRLITKGAIDYILPLCTHYWNGQKSEPLTGSIRKEILAQNHKMAEQALRVIAVAFRDMDQPNTEEKNMVFTGITAMADPPRPEAIEAVGVCRRAGIRPVMITGDHPDTAQAVAKEIGILSEDSRIMIGKELDQLNDQQLKDQIHKYSVFARVTPEHKVRIVKAWQARGEVVAMTGDGVNDAPALKTADIGCSLGIAGTEVAKSSSDMILSDDNFATIVEAVRQGRCIYSNIKKSVRFLLSSNTGEIITIFTGILLGWPPPLIAIQLLWVNLVTDSLPAIALGVDPPEDGIMHRNPDRSGLFNRNVVSEILLEGGMIGSLALLAFSVGRCVFADLTTARTMAFAVLSISQLVHAFNMRSEKSVFSVGLFKNKALCLSFAAGLLLQTAVINIPFLASLFKVVPLNGVQWLITAALSAAPLLIVELAKKLGSTHPDMPQGS